MAVEVVIEVAVAGHRLDAKPAQLLTREQAEHLAFQLQLAAIIDIEVRIALTDGDATPSLAEGVVQRQHHADTRTALLAVKALLAAGGLAIPRPTTGRADGEHAHALPGAPVLRAGAQFIA